MASSLLLEILQAEEVDCWVRAWQVLEHHRHTVLRHLQQQAHGVATHGEAVAGLPPARDDPHEQPQPTVVHSDDNNDADNIRATSPTFGSLAEHVDEQGWSVLHHAVAAAVRQRHVAVQPINQKKDGGITDKKKTAEAAADVVPTKSAASANNTTASDVSATKQAQQQEQRKYQRAVLRTLLELHPEATCLQTASDGWTPLHGAARTVHLGNLDRSDAALVRLLLQCNPAAALLKCHCPNVNVSRQWLPPLALHIGTVSRLVQQQTEPITPSPKLVQLLAPHCSREILIDALQYLYECNTAYTLERWAREEAAFQENRRRYGRQTRPAALDDCWVWTWAVALLKAIHAQQQQPSSTPTTTASVANQNNSNRNTATSATKMNHNNTTAITTSSTTTFRALHTAASITYCPVPFLLLALRAHPTQVRLASDDQHGNLPLHSIAQWQPQTRTSTTNNNSTGGSLCRKSLALTELVAAHRKALQVENADGHTPLALEALSGAVVE